MVYQPADTYWIEYTGTPPEKQLFVLHSTNPQGFIVQIKYSNAGSYAIYNEDREVVPPTKWDDSTANWGSLRRAYCGENRYEGVTNVLEFFITPHCPLTIQPRDAIMLGVRLEFTMAQFFANGGVTTFVDRMAASLGIHAADLKVVSVYEGSTIIDFQIISNLVDEIPLNLEEVQQTFEEVVSVMDTFMGSPLLNAISTGTPIVTPNTVIDDAGNIPDIFNFVGYEEDEEEVEAEVEIEVRYTDRSVDPNANKTNTEGYVAILGCIIVILVLVIVALCLYKSILSGNARVTERIPDSIRKDPEFESMRSLSKQYTPNIAKEVYGHDSGNFGGMKFDREGTA